MAPPQHSLSAKPPLSNLTLRVISAMLLAPIVLGSAYMGGVPFNTFLLFAAALMVREWCLMTRVSFVLPAMFLTLLACTLVAFGSLADAFIMLGAGVCVLYVMALVKKESFVWPVAGMVYVALPISSLILLREYFPQGMELVFWILATVWATDIGGYAAGKTIGGPKLAPSISPSKTWAGLLGGMFGAALVGVAFAPLLGGMGAGIWAAVSAVMAVIAQIGDLLESRVKRKFGVKDSGTLIPGHGGILDRVDGIVTVAPAVLAAMLAHGQGGVFTW